MDGVQNRKYFDQMNIRIDRAGPDDLSDIKLLLKALYLELGEESVSVSFLTGSLIREVIQSGQTLVFLARKTGNDIAGLVTLTECQSIYAGGKYGLLDELYVLPEFRSEGIGRKLIGKIISVARERKWKRIDVTTPADPGWEGTVKFYKDSNFVFTGQKFKLTL